MKILDAGTRSLNDFEVLQFIREKRTQHAADDVAAKAANLKLTKRPKNYLNALQAHQDHLEHADRPFADNAKYDEQHQYITELMTTLEPRVQLTKTELLMLINHRPRSIEQLTSMVEEIETRIQPEDQPWLLEVLMRVLGSSDVNTEQPAEDKDTTMAD